jgi:hypothetical protein
LCASTDTEAEAMLSILEKKINNERWNHGSIPLIRHIEAAVQTPKKYRLNTDSYVGTGRASSNL